MTSRPPVPGPHIGKSLKPQPGDRCSKTGGYWHLWKESAEAEESVVATEIQKVIGSLPEDDSREALSVLKDLMSKAEQGKLSPVDPVEYKTLNSHDPLLELRVQINEHSDVASRRHILRLYFAEPPKYRELLLGLKFARKPSGKDVAGTQERHIVQADQRYRSGATNGNTWGISFEAC